MLHTRQKMNFKITKKKEQAEKKLLENTFKCLWSSQLQMFIVFFSWRTPARPFFVQQRALLNVLEVVAVIFAYGDLCFERNENKRTTNFVKFVFNNLLKQNSFQGLPDSELNLKTQSQVWHSFWQLKAL